MEEARFEQNLKILKEWYAKQPHLPKGIDERYFTNFVAGTKSIEIAKQKIDAFFSIRHDVVWLRDFDNLMKRYLSSPGGDFFFLPGTTKEGWRVLVASYQNVDINKQDPAVELFARMISMELGLMIWPNDTSFALVYDLKGVTAGYFARLDFAAEVSVINFALKVLPRRMKKSMLLNSTPIIEKTTALFRPFISKKLNERVVLCPGDDGLLEFCPPSILPVEYGGTAGTVAELGKAWRQKIIDHEDWFRKSLLVKSDETKRPKESGTCHSLEQGLQGSFRTLSID